MSEKNGLYRPNLVDGLSLLAVGAVVICMMPANPMYAHAFRDARNLAETRLGDRQSPLTSSEKDEWYREMGVGESGRPTRQQLEEYVKSYNTNFKESE